MKRVIGVIGLVLAVVATNASAGVVSGFLPVAALQAGAATAFAQVPPPLPPNATVVASGLLNPRGFTFAPDGALVVAESGSPPAGFMPLNGPPTPMFRPGTTTTGRVSRIDLMSGQR